VHGAANQERADEDDGEPEDHRHDPLHRLLTAGSR
jgi:hypothetical protein